MREVVLDTETTGLSHADGHRVVEVGCDELMNCIPTGRIFHKYVNPERYMPSEAQRVHGLTTEFLAKHKLFADIAEELMEFIDGARLVIHNAEFDLGFLNMELGRADRPPIAAEVIDTVRVARRKFPGAPASLDALCERFGIDKSAREKHGALLDSQLLAEVYLELVGGRQTALSLSAAAAAQTVAVVERPVRPPRPHTASAEELAAHAAFLAKIKEPIWAS